MSNTIKLKRGSGSDPSANDLVVGELAIRTDSGKIFTKKDNGTVAEISGGGAGLEDGDKGDITVSNGGDTFTIDNGVVTSAKIADGTIVNADINASAAIAGTKISPNFGSQAITTTGQLSVGQLASGTQIVAGNPALRLRTTNASLANAGFIEFYHNTNNKAARIRGKARNTANGQIFFDVENDNTMTNILLVDDEGIDVTGNITGTGNFTLTSTDSGSSAAPELTLFRDSSSAADADYLGQIKFQGRDDQGSTEPYAKITGKIDDASAGNEDGILEFMLRKASTNNIAARFTSTDFKLINGTGLEVAGASTFNDEVKIEGNLKRLFIKDTAGTGNAARPGIIMQDSAASNQFFIGNGGVSNTELTIINYTDDSIVFRTNNTDRLEISNTGAITSTGNITISSILPKIILNDTNNESDFEIKNENGSFRIRDIDNPTDRYRINSSGTIHEFFGVASFTSNIAVAGTVDGVDIATRDTLFGGLTSSSGVLTNGVTATTQSAGDNSTKVATTAYTDTAIANLIDSSPSTLNTLNELASALGDDPNFATTVTNSIATKLANIVEDTTPQLGGTLQTNGNMIKFPDATGVNVNRLKFGTGDDLHVYHNGSHSTIRHEGTGSLLLTTVTGSIQLLNGSENMLIANRNGAVEAYYDNVKRLETTSTGATVTGSLTISSTTPEIFFTDTNNNSDFKAYVENGTFHIMDVTSTQNRFRIESDGDFDLKGNVRIPLDNKKLQIGASQDLAIYHTGTNNHIDSNNGILVLRSDTFQLSTLNGTKRYIDVPTDEQGVDLFYDGTERFGTTNTGVEVTGNIVVSGTVDGRDLATDGTKLDGIESNATADQTASEILTLIKTVDGAGSGLDADTLDGISSASFLRSDANDTLTGDLTLNGRLVANHGAAPATGANYFFSDDGSTTTIGTAATLRVANNGGNAAYSVFEAESGSGSIRLANDGKFYVTGSSKFSSFVRTDISSTVDGYMGEAYNTYFGLKHTDQTLNQEYMIISKDFDTFISATSGYKVKIRAGGNDSTNELQIGSGNDALTWRGNKVFHAGNDGSGSSLDADTVDGIQASSFLRSDATDTASGAITFTNSALRLSGHWYSGFHATTTNYIHLYPQGHSGNATQTNIRAWNGSSSDVFQINGGSSTGLKWRGNTIWTAENDGAGSGLNADTVDGVHGSSFLRSDAADTASANITINGAEVGAWSGGTAYKGLFHTNHDNSEYMIISNDGHTFISATTGSSVYIRGGGNNSSNQLVVGTSGTTIGGESVLTSGSSLNASNLGSGTIPSARLSASDLLTLIKTVDGSGSGLNAEVFNGKNDTEFLRSNVADTASGDITFSGGAGAVTIGGNSDIRLTNGNWTGNTYGKIQQHSNALYFLGGSSSDYSFILRYNANDRIYIKSNGTIWPTDDSSSDIGTNSNRWANVYADTFYGDGSNLTGISAGATGGGSDEVFYENGQTVTTDYTITNGKNAMAAGPITINSGVTVTVGSGENLTIV